MIGGAVTPVNELVRRASTAAFSRGWDGTVTAWNAAAARLLGRSRKCAVGRSCCDVIAGRDVFGNDYCGVSCIPWRMAVHKRPIQPFQLSVAYGDGRVVDLRVVIIRVPGASGTELVHLLTPATSVTLHGRCESVAAGAGVPVTSLSPCLTARELDVTRLLHQGYSTEGIAACMGISTTTVRNHVSRCLRKLDAHSRLEAVAVARRLRLV